MSDKYALIAAEQAMSGSAPSVRAMCAGLEVSRSGFYDWQRAVPSPRQLRRAKLTRHVHAAFEAGRGTYGVRRVHAVLTGSADPEVASASVDLVRSIMRCRRGRTRQVAIVMTWRGQAGWGPGWFGCRRSCGAVGGRRCWACRGG